MAVTLIEASADVDGLHWWSDAHDARAYLRSPHRHRFVCTVRLHVTHDDRDVEWHDLRDHIRHALHQQAQQTVAGSVSFGGQSCEALARGVARDLTRLGLNVDRVAVSEDGEFTAYHYPKAGLDQ